VVGVWVFRIIGFWSWFSHALIFPISMISLGARASGPQGAVRGDKPSVGASAHQQGGTRPSLISLGARASGPQGAVRGDSASVGSSAH